MSDTKPTIGPCACCRKQATHKAKDGTLVCEDCGPGYSFLIAKKEAGAK